MKICTYCFGFGYMNNENICYFCGNKEITLFEFDLKSKYLTDVELLSRINELNEEKLQRLEEQNTNQLQFPFMLGE